MKKNGVKTFRSNPMTYEWLTLIRRITNSLQRDGYHGLEAIDLGEGRVELRGNVADYNDQAIVLAIVRSVAGVSAVTNTLKLTGDSKQVST